MPKKKQSNRKRRGKKEGSVFQKPDGKWYAQISIQGLNGNRRRVTRTGNTKEHAVLLLSELQAGRPALRTAGSSDLISVSGYLDSWLETQIKSKAEATYCSFTAVVKNHIKPHIGVIRLADLAEEHINLWLNELANKKTGAATQHKAYKVLKSAMIHACKKGLIPNNPMEFTASPKATRKPIFPFTAAESKRILDVVKGDKYEAVYHLGLKCGMRQQEIFGLRWQDIDCDLKQVSIRQVASEVEGRIIIKEPKTSSSRRNVSLPQSTVEVIRQQKPGKRNDLVFTSESGGAVRRSNFSHRYWSKVLKKLELEHRGFHHCRHTAATLMLRANVPIHVVSGQLGHSSPSITLDIYAHYLPDDREQAASAIEDAINNG